MIWDMPNSGYLPLVAMRPFDPFPQSLEKTRVLALRCLFVARRCVGWGGWEVVGLAFSRPRSASQRARLVAEP